MEEQPKPVKQTKSAPPKKDTKEKKVADKVDK